MSRSFFFFSLSLSLFLSFYFSLSHTHSLFISLSHSQSHTHTLSHSLSVFLTLFQDFLFSLSFLLLLTLSLIHSLTRNKHTLSLPFSLPILKGCNLSPFFRFPHHNWNSICESLNVEELFSHVIVAKRTFESKVEFELI